jgi:ribose transport system ATP-binding protein
MTLLRVQGVSKSFFGVTVLNDVGLTLDGGEVLGLIGENGAGKSTLMKILGGVHVPDTGAVYLNDEPLRLGSPIESERSGISTVYQEFNLLPDRSVAENIFLGREPTRRGVVDRRSMRQQTASVLADIGVEGIEPSDFIRDLTVAQQQMVEIAKAISVDARVIQMDEPTSALAEHEVELLYSVVARLKSRGVGIIYVSHRLREITALCDRVVILKDGDMVAERAIADLNEQDMVRLMVGRPIADYFPPKPETAEGAIRLSVRAGGNDQLDSVDLDVRCGEILGVAGLQGSGRSELLAALFGAEPFTRGAVTSPAEPIDLTSPIRGIGHDISMIPEDRKGEGLFLEESIGDNALAVVRATSPGRSRSAGSELLPMLERLEVSARTLGQEVKFLSGGNQQKVVLAKWLLAEPNVLLMDEPTRGIDVGAKVAIYHLMRELAEQGFAIVMVSSELPELIGMSDRIVVMRDGCLVAALPGNASEVQILAAAMGAEDAA